VEVRALGFIKSWSKFVRKAELWVNDTLVFTPSDDGFHVGIGRRVHAREFGAARSTAKDLILILAIKVVCLFSVSAFVKLLLLCRPH
jgi:hypothetical protein